MESDLDRDGELHVYEQIAAQIARRIESGELAPGRPIPSETTLMQMYPGVARTTIRRSINRLREQGLVRTVPGRGSFVTRPEDRPR